MQNRRNDKIAGPMKCIPVHFHPVRFDNSYPGSYIFNPGTEEHGLPGCNAMSFWNSPSFWRHILPPSSESKCKPSMKPADSCSKLN